MRMLARVAHGAAKLLTAVVAAVVITACGGTSPPTRFFTLASEPLPGGVTTAGVYSVVVGPVTIPEVVDRPHLVLKSGSNRVEIADQARWAAPLESEIPRVVADHLARLLEGARTATSAQRAATSPDYRVLIDVQRFDTAPGEGATIQASWTVRPTGGTPVSGRTLATEAAGSGYEDLVAAHSRALATVSREIASAIRTLRPK